MRSESAFILTVTLRSFEDDVWAIFALLTVFAVQAGCQEKNDARHRLKALLWGNMKNW
jgi:hypothetical protein